MSAYTVTVTEDGPGWTVEVPSLGRTTYARHIREVRDMATDLIAIMTGDDDIIVTIAWPEPISAALDQ